MADNRSIVTDATKWFVSQFPWPNSVMFHYTSRVAFEAILNTRRMWAMDLRSMNDPRELLHGKAMIDERFATVVDRFRGLPTEVWLRRIVQLFDELIVQHSSTFSISLSEHRDMPHQWKNYAADGTGFVLGWSIDSSYLGTPLKTWVTYDRVKQQQLIEGLIDFHATAMHRGLLATDAAERERVWLTAGESLFRFLNAVWLTFKEPQWSREAEFRYVYHVLDNHLPDWCAIKTRPDTGRRYIEADFASADLKYVGIGPKNEARTTRKWVDEILKRNNFTGVHVEHSKVRLGK